MGEDRFPPATEVANAVADALRIPVHESGATVPVDGLFYVSDVAFDQGADDEDPAEVVVEVTDASTLCGPKPKRLRYVFEFSTYRPTS